VTGRTFGRLVVTGPANPSANGLERWSCVCSCGARATVVARYLRRGETRSCGCLRIETARSLMAALRDA
jgi:hypothetical protein